MRKRLTGLLAGIGLTLACTTSVFAQELTIFWAEWDPANYLQELANEYEKETGVKVTVETTPWADFQTKAFTEFNAKGSAYDMVVGDSQWTGAASEAGHYVDLTDFFNKHKLNETMAPATVKYYSEYPANSGKYWSVPAEGDAVGWSYRKDWFEDPKEMEAFKAKYGYDLAPPKDWKQLRDIAEFFYRPDEKRYGIAIYTDNSYDGLVMGVENAMFSFGGELGDYANYKVDGIINSEKNVKALEAYRELYGFTPPGWAKTFFVENNQAITENLAAMSMNYFAFFPALVNEASNPNAKNTGFFANPAGPGGDQFAALLGTFSLRPSGYLVLAVQAGGGARGTRPGAPATMASDQVSPTRHPALLRHRRRCRCDRGRLPSLRSRRGDGRPRSGQRQRRLTSRSRGRLLRAWSDC